MHVPFVDLKTQYQSLRDEIMASIDSVCSRTAFILGPEIDAFEKAFAEFCEADECVGVASGCDALLWGLRACNVGPGDEVITTTSTYIASVLAISTAGATPVLVDCLADTWQIDPQAVEAAITPKTRAIMPVHLYGQPVDMDAIMALAKRHELLVIEDAAQAHGARYRGRRCGTIGDVGCFSFYPGKNLGAYGDGGAIVTHNKDVADRIRCLRNYGQTIKYHHEEIGWNSRLDTVQAAVLLAKIKHLEAWNERRRSRAAEYRKHLEGSSLELPTEVAATESVHHLFPVLCERRDELIKFLGEQDVQCGIHYPIPVHLQNAYKGLGFSEGAFPVAERIARRTLSLPMFPELTDEQIAFTCEQIKRFLAGS